jgi:outer membrane protein assembly factor BamB
MTIKLRQTAAIRVARGPIVLDTPLVTPTAIFTGESNEFVVKLDKRTHKQAWKKKMMVWLRSAHGDNILVYAEETDETQLWNGDGRVLWQRPGDEDAFDGRLYFDTDGRLQIVDVLSGRIVDEFESPPGYPHLLHDGILLRTNEKGPTDPVQAVDLAARSVRWEQNLIPAIQARLGDPCPRGLSFLATRPGHVVAKSGAHLVAVSLTDGSLGWGMPISAPYGAHAKAGRIYVWSADNHLVIVDEDSGAIVVDRALSEYGSTFSRVQEAYGATICRNHILFTTSSGLMALFRLSDGALVWQHEHGDYLFSPVVDDRRVYVTSAEGNLIVFDVEGGEL